MHPQMRHPIIMKYASVTYVKTLRVNSFILEGELCPSVRKTLLIPDSTAPCPAYRTDTQKYIRPGRERGDTENTRRDARYTRYRFILGTANW